MLSNPTFGHCFILACVFVGFEIVTPGVFFFSLGIAAAALVEFIFPDINGLVQYALFAVFCITSLILWKRFGQSMLDTATDQP